MAISVWTKKFLKCAPFIHKTNQGCHCGTILGVERKFILNKNFYLAHIIDPNWQPWQTSPYLKIGRGGFASTLFLMSKRVKNTKLRLIFLRLEII